MNAELRAQLEGLEVWHKVVDASQQPKTRRTSEGDERAAWNAYLASQNEKTSKIGDVKAKIHVPERFRKFAIADGIDIQSPVYTPPTSTNASTRRDQSLDMSTKCPSSKPENIQNLENQILEQSEKLKETEKELQAARQRETEVHQRYEQLNMELIKCQNSCTELNANRSDLSLKLQRADEERERLETEIDHSLRREASLKEEVEKSRRLIESQLQEPSPSTPVDHSKLDSVQQELDVSRGEISVLRQENTSILNKMKHAKQQFDKLRAQSHERNVENAELKQQIEDLGENPSPPPTEEINRLQSLVTKAQNQRDEMEAILHQGQEEKAGLEQDLAECRNRCDLLSHDVCSHQELQKISQQTIAQQIMELATLKTDLDACQKELESKNNALEIQREEAGTWKTGMEATLQNKNEEMEDLLEMLDEREREITALQSIRENVTFLTQQLSAKDTELEAVNIQLGELYEELVHQKNRAKTLEESRDALEDLLQKRESETSKLNEELKTLKSREASLQNELDTNQELLQKREADVLKLKEELLPLVYQLEQTKGELEVKESGMEEQIAAVQTLQAELVSVRANNDETLKEKEDEIDGLNSQLQNCLIERDDLEAEVAKRIAEAANERETLAEARLRHETEIRQNATEIEKLRVEKSELMRQLGSMGEALKECETAQARVTELDEKILAGKQREESAGEKIHELDTALTEALEIAEIADRDSRQAAREIQRLREETQAATTIGHQFKAEAEASMAEARQLKDGMGSREQELTLLRSQLMRKEVETESLRTRFQTTETQLNEQTAELVTLRHELSVSKHTSAAVNEKDSEIHVIKGQLQTMTCTKDELDASIIRFKAEHREKQSQLMALQSELEEETAQGHELRNQLDTSKQYQYELLEKIQTLQNAISSNQRSAEAETQLQQRLTQTIAAKERLVQEVHQLKQNAAEVVTLQQKIIRLETALAVSGPSRPPAHLTAQLQSFQQRTAKAEAREADLYAEIESLRLSLEEAHEQARHIPGPSTSAPQLVVGGMSNKKDEDKGYDVEAAVLSGGDPSGFQPLSGLLRGIPAMKYLTVCIRGADFMDRGFILLMRYPLLRYFLLVYCTLLHCVLFV